LSKWQRSDDPSLPWGRPCPWCDELIEHEWTKHTFVVRDGILTRPGKKGVATDLPNGLYGDCPHCEEVYAMEAKIAPSRGEP